MWVWWSSYADAAVFKCDFEEREMLLAADLQTFAWHPHHDRHRLSLARGGRIGSNLAELCLIAD